MLVNSNDNSSPVISNAAFKQIQSAQFFNLAVHFDVKVARLNAYQALL